MKRTYKKQPLFDPKRFGPIAFTLFVAFIAYKILTPPSQVTPELKSPDGSKSARLRTVSYFDGQPSYKIYFREIGERNWQILHHLPTYTNAPAASHKAAIEWSPDSETLYFRINDTNIWSHVFDD